jgi:hypothetical protein
MCVCVQKKHPEEVSRGDMGCKMPESCPESINFGQSPKLRCPMSTDSGQRPKQRCPESAHFGQSPKQRCPK